MSRLVTRHSHVQSHSTLFILLTKTNARATHALIQVYSEKTPVGGVWACEGRDPQRPIPRQTPDPPPIGLMSRLSFWTTDPALLIRIPLARSLSISVWVIQYET